MEQRSGDIVVQVEGVGKRYRLGTTNRQQLVDEFKAWVARMRGKPDPTEKIGPGVTSRRSGDHFWALRDVSFEVRHGEVLGVIGRNGAGKSTLLKLLSRITLPTEGAIRMRGKVSSLLEVGTGFHPELTGRQNIYLNGAILGMRRTEVDSKLEEIIEFSGITDHIDTPVKRYSSGMRVRLGFAVAAHLEPEILIVDEVLSVGDAEFQRKSMGKMKDAATAGRTVLFVSHNMAAMRSLCHRVIWLEDGRVRMSGAVEEVVDAYLNAYSEDRTEIHWNDPATAPRHELAQLRHISIKPASGGVIFNWDDPIDVEIGLENVSAEEGLGVTIQVLDGAEQVVFATNARENIPDLYVGTGSHRLGCRFPARLFNEGHFRLNVLVNYRAKSIIRVTHVVSFNVKEPVRKDWFGKRAGMFRIELPWTHQKLEREGPDVPSS